LCPAAIFKHCSRTRFVPGFTECTSTAIPDAPATVTLAVPVPVTSLYVAVKESGLVPPTVAPAVYDTVTEAVAPAATVTDAGALQLTTPCPTGVAGQLAARV